MRDRYFRGIAPAGIAASRLPPLNPYWGDLGGFPAWGDEACLPLEENQTFGGGGDEVLRAILAETAPDIMAPPDRMLVTLARKDLSRARRRPVGGRGTRSRSPARRTSTPWPPRPAARSRWSRPNPGRPGSTT